VEKVLEGVEHSGGSRAQQQQQPVGSRGSSRKGISLAAT